MRQDDTTAPSSEREQLSSAYDLAIEAGSSSSRPPTDDVYYGFGVFMGIPISKLKALREEMQARNNTSRFQQFSETGGEKESDANPKERHKRTSDSQATAPTPAKITRSSKNNKLKAESPRKVERESKPDNSQSNMSMLASAATPSMTVSPTITRNTPTNVPGLPKPQLLSRVSSSTSAHSNPPLASLGKIQTSGPAPNPPASQQQTVPPIHYAGHPPRSEAEPQSAPPHEYSSMPPPPIQTQQQQHPPPMQAPYNPQQPQYQMMAPPPHQMQMQYPGGVYVQYQVHHQAQPMAPQQPPPMGYGTEYAPHYAQPQMQAVYQVPMNQNPPDNQQMNVPPPGHQMQPPPMQGYEQQPYMHHQGQPMHPGVYQQQPPMMQQPPQMVHAGGWVNQGQPPPPQHMMNQPPMGHVQVHHPMQPSFGGQHLQQQHGPMGNPPPSHQQMSEPPRNEADSASTTPRGQPQAQAQSNAPLSNAVPLVAQDGNPLGRLLPPPGHPPVIPSLNAYGKAQHVPQHQPLPSVSYQQTMPPPQYAAQPPPQPQHMYAQHPYAHPQYAPQPQYYAAPPPQPYPMQQPPPMGYAPMHPSSVPPPATNPPPPGSAAPLPAVTDMTKRTSVSFILD